MLNPSREDKLMLDVHAPEHSISGVRDFLLHLFTITCGLLIALALENAAEAVHHRHERQEAEESVRRELQENLAGAKSAAPHVLQERAGLAILLRFVERRSDGSQEAPPSLASLSFSEDEIPDAAWRTASSTGVLALMDYAQVQRFAGAYREQELLQQQEQQALTDILQLGSFIRQDRPPAALTSAEAKEALPYVRRALADLDGILAVGAGMVEAYQNALK